MTCALPRLFLAATLTIAAAPLSACGAPEEPQFSGPWADDFELGYSQVTTDFQREILRDGQVTEAEYNEARQRFVQCAADKGIDVTLNDSGFSYQTQLGNQTEGESITDECSESTKGWIEPLYLDPLWNPENLPWDEVYLACFKELGIVDESMTVADMARWEWNYDNAKQRACSDNPQDPVVIERPTDTP